MPPKLHPILVAAVSTLASTLLFGQASSQPSIQGEPLDRVEILGRLAAGFTPSYVAHLVKIRGVNFWVSADFLDNVRSAGGAGILVERLSSAEPPGSSESDHAEEGPVYHLAQCAELLHTGDSEPAKQECRASIDESPKSAWPLLVNTALESLSPQDSPEAEEEIAAKEHELLRRVAALAPNLTMVQKPEDFGLVASSGDGIELGPLAPEELLEVNEHGVVYSLPQPGDEASRDEAEIRALIRGDGTAARVFDSRLQSNMRIEPELASNHVGLAGEYMLAHEPAEVEIQLREALRLEPDSPRLHEVLGEFYISQKQSEAGLAEYREAMRIAPGDFSYRIGLSFALESLGRTAEAMSEMKALIALHPAAPQPTEALVNLYLEHDDLKSAIEARRSYFKAAEPGFPDEREFVLANFDALKKFASLLKYTGDLDAAGDEYARLLRFYPEQGELHVDYGDVLLGQHRCDRAVAEYNEALKVYPGDPGAHAGIGICMAANNDLDGAIDEFEKGVEGDQITNEKAENRVLLGAALGQKGNVNAAMDQFQRALESFPNDADLHAHVGAALLQLNNAAGAIGELKRALELQPDSPEAENNLAWMYATADDPKLRNPTEALALARHAVESSPPNQAFLDTLAEALLINGHAAEALATEEQAAKLDPENPQVQSRLAHFRNAAGSSKP